MQYMLIVLNIMLLILIITNTTLTYIDKRGYERFQDEEESKIKMKDITFSHPDGRVWKNDVSWMRLNKGSPSKFSIYSDPSVINHNLLHFGLLQDGNLHTAVEHFYYNIRITPFRNGDINFPWCFMKSTTDTVYIWNPWNGGWFIGYDEKTDNLLIVQNKDPRKIAWRMNPMPPIEYLRLL